MKKIFTFLFLFITTISFSQVRISQVYGGGGNSGATYNQDFVELFNAGSSSVNIGGWSIQYASATGPTTPFNWAVASIPSGATIAAGGYYLFAFAIGTIGIALPTPDAPAVTINLAGSAGKVALVNTTTVLNGTTACGGATVVDVLGYGLNATCSETSVFNGSTIPSTQSIKRANNGCSDANNNSTDFALATVLPRNSGSALNPCSITATISAAPSTLNATTVLGTASASQFFNLSAANLTPAAGNLTITPTTGLEFSFDNTNFFSTFQTQAYTGAALTTTQIYVRIAATAAQGALSAASVTISGGGAVNAVVTITGGVSKNYYSNSTGSLNIIATWGDASNGAGTAPADFASGYQIFNVSNRTNSVIGGHWDVSGTASKIVIGDGTNPTILTTSIADSIKSSTIVDISSAGTLEMGSRVAPTFGILATNSTVDYNFNGTTILDTVKINNNTYHNLKLSNGLKYLKSGTTTINGNFTYDGTANSNGSGTPFSTVILKGNLSMTNNALIEDSTTGFPNRYTLTLTGTTSQNINTGTSELRIFRVQKDTTAAPSNLDIILAANSKIAIGNSSGGELKLLQKISGTPTVTRMIMASDAQFAIVRNASVYTDALLGRAGALSTTDANIIMNKSISSTTNPGTLKFEPGSTLKNLTINITTPTKDSVTIGNTVLVNTSLNLVKGVFVVAAGQSLQIGSAASVTGGDASSYVDGAVKRFMTIPSQLIKLFPVGQAKQFSPVEIASTLNNNYTVQYFKQPYSNTNINATTTASFPTYNVSTKEYWDIAQGGAASADIKFYYNNPSSNVIIPTQTKIAHFNGTDWDNLDRDGNSTDANGTYIFKNSISSFSPFTFGGVAGVLPIVLQSFSGSIENNTSKLQWKTTCESNGDSFRLQYSTDGIKFIDIYTTNAVGNCNGNTYDYIHHNVKANVNFYRLSLQRLDGRIKLSNVVTLKNTKNIFETKIISTNIIDQIGLSITSPIKGSGFIKIVNIQGQQMYNQTVTYQAGFQIRYINTNLWSNGLYFITLTNNDGEVSANKFIK